MGIKYRNLAAELRIAIQMGVYRANELLPTEMALVESHQVSRQTVRKALSVLEEEGLIQRRQGSGSRVLSKPANRPKERNVAIIATFVDDYLFPSLLHHVQLHLEKSGFSTLIFSTQNQFNREREILQNLLDNPVRGILIEGVKSTLPNPNLDLYQQLQARSIPIVFFHSSYPGLDCVSIADDNVGGGYLAAEHLLDLGHSRIGGLFKCDDIQGPQRCAGFFQAMRERGYPFPDERIIWYSSAGRKKMVEQGRNQWMDEFILHDFRECTALICYNDEVAYALVKALLRLNLRVPRDMAVCSFDNTYYSDISPVPITSLSHNTGKLGEEAAFALLELIQGRSAQSKKVGWTLVRKKST